MSRGDLTILIFGISTDGEDTDSKNQNKNCPVSVPSIRKCGFISINLSSSLSELS